MKGKMLSTVTLLSVFSIGRVEAQWCLPKMRSVKLKAELSEADGYVLGAMLSSYAKGGNKWVYGVEYLRADRDYRNMTIPTVRFTAEEDYYYNFLSDTKEVVFFYADVSTLVGYEAVNQGEKTLHGGARLNSRDVFVYDYVATLEMEPYLVDFIALMTPLRERFLWGGNIGVCHTEYGIDVKFIINW